MNTLFYCMKNKQAPAFMCSSRFTQPWNAAQMKCNMTKGQIKVTISVQYKIIIKKGLKSVSQKAHSNTSCVRLLAVYYKRKKAQNHDEEC